MSKTETNKSQLHSILLEQTFSPEQADKLLENLTEDQAAEALANLLNAEAEKVALRQRLMADPALRAATTPANHWKTADERFAVAKTAVAILENTAKAHDISLSALVMAMAENGDSMQSEIDANIARGCKHQGDPRIDRFGKTSFFAFRCRVRDAVQTATQEQREAERKAAEAKREAKWAAQGLERCQRCGGAGGHKGWPGFTCFECGGSGATVA